MGSALRVLQAADLCLHEPLESVGRLPAPLREIFNQARERSALRILNAAIARDVDLLLLTGTLADFQAEPRLACFLMEQFRRLHAAGISIVWATDQASLLPVWSLRPEMITCLLPGQSTVVSVPNTHRQILVHHTRTPISAEQARRDYSDPARQLIMTVCTQTPHPCVEYIGASRKQLIRHDIVPVHHSGPSQQGPTGMQITEFDPEESPRTALIPIQTVVWSQETIRLDEHHSRESLLEEMQRRSRGCHQPDQVEMTCLEWILTGTSPLWDDLIDAGRTEELLQEFRQAAGRDSRIWSWKIHLQPAAEQYQAWTTAPATAEGFRQLDQLSTSDLAASAAVPSFAGTVLRGPILTQSEFGAHRIRLVRELRTPLTIGAENTCPLGSQ